MIAAQEYSNKGAESYDSMRFGILLSTLISLSCLMCRHCPYINNFSYENISSEVSSNKKYFYYAQLFKKYPAQKYVLHEEQNIFYIL